MAMNTAMATINSLLSCTFCNVAKYKFIVKVLSNTVNKPFCRFL